MSEPFVNDRDEDLEDEGLGNENDIAIVGMAMRVPGAQNPQEYWENVRDGVESVRHLSEEELLEAGESPEALRHPDYVRATGGLDNMSMFDGEFFGFSPKESAILDPQHRHFTECCWEALEDAAHPPEKFEGQIGLFGGCGMGSYFYFNICSNRELVDSVGHFLLRHTGNDKDFLVTRVSYLLDLKGPSVNVQTACSTSLVATHLACQSLLSGESDMALAGGVTILQPHDRGYIYHEGEVLSPDGHCHAFDHRAQGTVLTSGAGVVVLRRLKDAIEDGDNIYAVIRGSAINNDGGSKVGYLAPSVDGQAAAMSEAYAVADINPETLDYIECHGTGTYMGDPIEVSALTQAFNQHTEKTGFCRLASVKTNIGHLDTAAGVAGLIKVAKSLENKQIAPTINFEAPNPVIEFESTPFVVNQELCDWPETDSPKRAAVNSLGVGGTNAHVIVEEAPAAQITTESNRGHQLLMLSARNNKALEGNSKKLAEYLRGNPDTPLADVAYTLDVGRRGFDRRRVLVVSNREEAIEFLESGNPRRLFNHGVTEATGSVAFMFSGAGTQYPRMAAGLYEAEPVFRKHLDRGINLLNEKTGYDFRKLFFAESDQLDAASAELEITERQLPAIFVLEIALAELWKSWNIHPEVMIGHSMGENTAACLAGVLSYEDTLDLMILRGVLMTRAPAGAMTSVALPPDELTPLLAGEIDLAIINTPNLCVASGAVEAVEALEQKLTERDVDFRRLQIPVAAHSRMFDPILAEFRQFLESVELQPPSIPFISNRTGKLITDEQATDPGYWVDHLRHTVFFADGIETLLSKPGRVLIELGPGQALASFAKQHPNSRQQANVIPTMRHRDDEMADSAFFLASVGRCWASGLEIDFGKLREGETRKRVQLPTYAWSHQSYFIEPTVLETQGEDLANLTRIEKLADWGHVPVWERQGVTGALDGEPRSWLLFMDDAGVGRRLQKRLIARGDTVVCVERGDAYLKRDEHTYTIAPERGRAGYDVLVQDLVASGKVPTHIAHLWLVTAEERFRPGSSFFHQNLQDGFYSLFFIAQALGDENVATPLQIDVVSNGMQGVDADDAVLYPEKATALGPVKVIPRELPGVTCRSIDVRLPVRPENTLAGLRSSFKNRGDSNAETLDSVADLLETELLGEASGEDVAHRGRERLVRHYRAERLVKPGTEQTSGLRVGGTYLITGGLGGLGLTMAERLATELKAKLVLVGRTPMPEREEWDDWLRSRGGDDSVGRKIRKVQELERAGAEVLVLAGDVTNPDQMRDIFQAAGARFGVVHGVLHTAGVVKDELIQLKLESNIADVFGPKVHGTVVLDSLLEEAGIELLVLFSSTSSIAAPGGQIDYVAANAYLDAYATSKRKSSVRTVAVNWGIWNDVGMAAESFGSNSASETSTVDAHAAPPSHPLFTTREKDGHGRTVFAKTYSPEQDWILDEHRTKSGHALMPGTGYPELVRAALGEYNETGPFEIRDLYFLRPLYVPNGETRDVRVMLRSNERGYRFEVRTGCTFEGRAAWELNAQASVEYGHREVPAAVDLAGVNARCTKSRSEVDPNGLRSGQEEHVRFGPRWRVLRQVFYGDDEALAELELPDAFASDLDAFGLHPALLDYSTGYAMELIDGYQAADALWVPVSYGRFAVYDNMPKRVFSWVRKHANNTTQSDFAIFDITICDENGRVVLEIEEFTIHRLAEEIEFGITSGPSRGDVAFEAALGSGDQRGLSPAELRLRRNYEQGIRPEEGSEALARVLAGGHHPQVVVSSLELGALVRQVEMSTDVAAESGTKFERPELDSEYVEARDDIERMLVGFWEELLGVDQLGVHDSFFDLGGHSLIAVRLFAMIKKAYQVAFPISVLFEAPTIEGCAEMIRDAVGDTADSVDDAAPASDKRRTRYKYLVAMHAGEGGPKTPFFLVAGMFGNVLNLRHLANLVGSDRPFYGLQAQGLYGDEPPHETFQEMAMAYIAEMKTVQPKGPYYVGGFSGGGLTAFEIAQQLLAQGEEIGVLLLLDSRLPQTPRLTKVDRAKIQLHRLKSRGPGYAAEWARNRFRWQIEQLQARFDLGEPQESNGDQFNNTAIEAAFRAALPRYQMQHFPGKLVLFRPKLDNAYVLGKDRVLDSAKEWVWHDNGFGQWAESIDIHEMPGDHDSMVLEPNVRVMASQLSRCLSEAEARATKRDGEGDRPEFSQDES